MKIRFGLLAFTFMICLILGGGLERPAQAGPPAQEPLPQGRADLALLDRLQRESSGPVEIAYHTETGLVRFIGSAPERPLVRSGVLPAGASPEAAARTFLTDYGNLFGLRDQGSELHLVKERSPDRGRAFVRFQQRYQGIPVVGGELVVQLSGNREVISANGEILPGLNLSINPAISAEAARQTALEATAAKYQLDPAGLVAGEPALWIFNPALLGGPGPRYSRLVWRLEVEPAELAPVKELVLVDAQRGSVALQFNQIHTARNRLTYTANNLTTLPGSLLCNEGQSACNGDAHAQAAHKYAADTYNFYFNTHGRDGINGAGLTIISTVHYRSNYQNAFWDGVQVAYGDGAGYPLADDVVAHELTHGVTQYESDLYYYYQAGAINESLSDIWGEFVDLTNGAGNDSAGVRWQLGENVTGLGAIRNMKDPTLFSDPDRMTSSFYYSGNADSDNSSGDNGGVHTNSGVNNKAVYLLTDGGTFNGRTVTALGITKVAKIYYEAQTNLLISGSDYADLYNLLYQACLNLVGTSGITGANCQEVRDATLAVEMNQQPVSFYNTEASLCGIGKTPSNLFLDTLEAGSGNWVSGALSGTNRWGYGSPYGSYAASGSNFFYADDFPASVSDSFIAMKNSVALPAGAYLHFVHAYGFKNGDNDGGVLEYSTNGGGSWSDAGSLIEVNSYDGPLGAGNPLSGRPAFMGDSHGYISSRLNLASLAGQSVRFRWRMATDNGGYDQGWWLDDVRVYRCVNSGQVQTNYLPLIVKPAPLLANGNFESGATAWTQFSSNGFGLILPANQFPGTVSPHSGNYAVWLGGALNETSSIRQQVLVPANKPYLAYWHWVASQDSCGYDFGGVVINSATVSSYDLCSSKNTTGWVKRVVNLSSYAGQSVALQIRAETDSALNSNLFIDDISFQASAATLETSAADGPTSEAAAAAKPFEPDASAAEKAEFLLRPAGWKAR